MYVSLIEMAEEERFWEQGERVTVVNVRDVG